MELSLDEALSYLIIVLEEEKRQAEEKRWKMYINYLSMLKSRTPETEDQARDQIDFLEVLDPDNKPKASKDYELEWDMKAIEEANSL